MLVECTNHFYHPPKVHEAWLRDAFAIESLDDAKFLLEGIIELLIKRNLISIDELNSILPNSSGYKITRVL